MAATYFGEVTELDSRAVWYSDEEDEDEEEDLLDTESGLKQTEASSSHEYMRSNVSLSFERFIPTPLTNVRDCIISLVSTAQYKNSKVNDMTITLLGQYKNLAKVFICSTSTQGANSFAQPEGTLWLMFDQDAPWITGMEVSYLVETFLGQLYAELELNSSAPVIILTKQFSTSEHLEYLSNCLLGGTKLALPFSGRPTSPPELVRNSFESSLFEQLTLAMKLAYVVSLPDPRNYCFDRALFWPTIPSQIAELRLNDHNLEKTLIFT